METKNFLSVKCSGCQKELEAIDLILIDETNALTHVQCPHKTDVAVKDLGYYKDILEKYLHIQ
ncbi:hypothetical protein [Peribacillus glennii]|uniref:Uncharacterized protein n=1 Tax=Peribacillus glennii TaxID=2303991 RepID=A0A372LHE8_9BACI|nr:hypothetical protein [Peribacillus glennii]RFU65036.1 hypothetical protein D0466_03740 [Peribacillus glennii]